jgi:predicted NAD/FAD-dependent oxidoreductase
MPAMRIVVIGAGISGLACSELLTAAGHDVHVFDKARGPGGRMSTRRVDLGQDTMAFDHAAQYFTARHPDFIAQVAAWAGQGLVARWPEAGQDAWVGLPAMNAPVAHMAKRLMVAYSSHVMSLARDGTCWHVTMQGGQRHGPFDAAIVALPAEQAAAFLGAHDLVMASLAMAVRSQPCWTMLAAFDGPLPISSDVIRQSGVLAWAARNGSKPGRAPGEAWVVQAEGTWSIARLEQAAEDIAQTMLKALTARAADGPLPALRYLSAHRWRYAMVRSAEHGSLWNKTLRLGACGDWLLGPRVELAWRSGRQLAQTIAGDLVTIPPSQSADAKRKSPAHGSARKNRATAR